MFQPSALKKMRWNAFIKDIKDKVGLSPNHPSSPSSPTSLPRASSGHWPPVAAAPGSAAAIAREDEILALLAKYESESYADERGEHELELDFKRFWDFFLSSTSQKEKETTLSMAISIFCRLVKQQQSVTQLIAMLVEAHIFTFVIGRTLVADIEKFRISNSAKSLHAGKVLSFLSETIKDRIRPGSNLLFAIEVLVSVPINKQPFLDSGVLCCLVHVFNAFVNFDEINEEEFSVNSEDLVSSEETCSEGSVHAKYLELEESIVHVMKALASHPSAAFSLTEDESLKILFQIVATGSLKVFSQFKQGLVPLHVVQLHRHAMQILGLLLLNDNGSTASYIHKHHLIKVFLMAVKDFNPDFGDSAYTVGIVDLLLECVELSYRPGAGSIRLKEDIHNSHGYQFLVQFALTLSCSHDNVANQSRSSDESTCMKNPDPYSEAADKDVTESVGTSPVHVYPSLSRLLDIFASLAQTGPAEPAGFFGVTSLESTNEIWGSVNTKVQDLEAIQMLQDIFLKFDNIQVKAEVLDIMFKIFTNHVENYKLCQQLRTVPLFILNMGDFPPLLQEKILKILEYAVIVVNCIPEQELLALCCLLQQPITSYLKHAILSFFVKLLSFDNRYKKVLREVGVLEVLIDDLKQHKFISGAGNRNKNASDSGRNSTSSSFKKHIDSKDVILSTSRLMGSGSAKFPLFEDDGSIAVAWDCLLSLLKKDEANQSLFRSASGFSIALSFLVSDIHRSAALRLLSCLIIEDTIQVHSEELGFLIETLKSGIVGSLMEQEYKLVNDAKSDILGALWRILGANSSVQKIFGEATGFSLLLTTLYSFQSDGEHPSGRYSLASNMKVFSCLLRVMTAAVRGNDVNRLRLNTTVSSETFFDLLRESNLISDGYEKQVIQVLLELAFEIILPPSSGLTENALPSNVDEPDSISFMFEGSLETFMPETERVYNASAVMVLIRSLLLFTSKVQLKLLLLIEKLASASSFNQENLTSAGCVGLLLDITSPLLTESSPVLMHALRIVEVLGAYRLSTLELRLLVKYTLQMKSLNSGYYLVDMMEKLIQRQDTMSESVPLAPFVEMDMSRTGHASIQSSLGERTWPPNAGYSFVCWFQYQYFSHSKYEEHELQSEVDFIRSNTSGRHSGEQILRLFSVGAVDDSKTFYLEIYLQDTGVLTLATSSSSKLSFSDLKLEEGRWYHLAIVHSKPNAIAGLFQDGIAYIYLNGKLTHTGNLGYSPSPVGKPLQVTIGTPLACAKVGNLSWRLRCCYLFEEVLTAGGICFMYILGRGYRGIFQDADLLKFVPILSCGGDSMSILDSLDSELSAVSKLESISKDRHGRLDGSNIVWDSHRLFNLSLQLRGRKLIFAFDGASSEVLRAFGRPSMLNLVDPKCAAASPIGGIPRFGILEGDSYLCHQYVIGNCIRTVGGMTVILALVEAAETRDMLHMALTLLACALRQNPQNLNDMQYCRGYHLLAIFLHHRMSLFDMQSLDIFFQIAACEATFAEQDKFKGDQKKNSTESTSETSFEILSSRKFSEEKISSGSQGDTDVFPVRQDSFNHRSEPGTINLTAEIPKCIVLSNADMIEYVLLDWTLWVTSPVSIQLALLGFFEELVSLHWYRNHNLAFLRQINLVQHLLVALQRDDVEVQVLEKLVILLSVIFEDGFLVSELDLVARFVTMTFDPPEPSRHQQIVRETGGKHLIVRNLLLEMIIDLQLTITSDELLDQWYEILSVKFIMFFLDGYVHPTSMTWIMTLLGVCLASSPTFAHEFQSSGGYQVLTHVLPNYYDTPDIYYIVFCLIFGKSVYPRKPEISIGDFHALMPNDGLYGELKFVELQDSVIAMAKSAFDKLSMHSVLVESENLSHFGDFDVAKLADAANDYIDNLQAESPSSMASARLMSGEAAAPASATSVMRFMVDLAKMCPPFSAICRRTEFLESCVDLYFSCVRADSAVKASKHLKAGASEDSPSGTTGSQRNQHALISLIQEKAQMASTYREHQRVPQVLTNAHSEELHRLKISPYDDNDTKIPRQFNTELDESVNKDGRADNESTEQAFVGTFGTKGFSGNSHYSNNNPEDNQLIHPTSSLTTTDLPNLTKKSDQATVITQSPVLALTSWLASKGSSNGGKVQLASRSFTGSPASAMNVSPEPLTSSQDLSVINSKLLVEIEESGDAGGSCSAGASAILDFIAIVLSDIVSEQSKASQDVENILESSPSYVDVESVLVFQGLCLGRLMNFLERRLIRDDEKGEKKLDKNIWSVNLGALCWMIVDRVYMGAFPQPAGVLKALEFLLSMLQLANKDGGIEKAVPAGKGLLSVSRGGRQLDTYVRALLKSANRMIMYCFLPSFLVSIEEEDFLSMLGFQTEQRKSLLMQTTVQDESIINIGKVLQLIFAHKQLVLSPSNLDTDLICCLCVNLISLLRDQRRSTRNLAVEIIKYMLVHRRAAVEELLAANPYQGQNLNVLDGGFDKLLTGSSSMFFEWLHASEQNIEKVLEQCAALMWTQYIGGSAKFPGIRIKGMEGRRGKKMGKKLKDESASDLKHWEHVNEQRRILKLASNAMSTELRVVRQNKYGWVLHAESEWQNHLQQLVHERGIIPLCNSLEPEWKLCIIEGPYRMRKKLERCKLKTDMIQTFMVGSSNLKERKRVEEKDENSLITSQSNSNSASNLLSGSLTQNVIDGGEYDDSLFEADDYREESMSSRISWNDGQVSSVDGASLHSAKALAAKSPVETPYRNNSNSSMDSPEKLSYMKIGRLEMKLHDSGEYLIRPYLEHLEKIRFKYNCERVVGLDKHDGIFLIGELCLYVIGNVYIDDYGRICEKQCEDALSVIDQALGVKEDTTGSYDNQTKSSSTLGVSAKPFLRGRAWAYNGGGWDKEKVHSYSNLPHPWHMWKLGSVHEVLKRDYQLRPVAIEIFSIDGCNNLLVFHKREREEVFRNLVSIIPPRNNMLSNSMSGLSKQESNASSPPFKITAKSITKRWQNGEISNFQYLMHLNTLAGRGYNDLTQYPVFPWVLADYESENLDLTNPETFRKFDKPVGCQTIDGEEEFKNRYEAWDDPDVPQFHYGSHYSSAGIVLFYLLRLPPFSTENQKLQGGQFDRADRLFTSVRDTWLSAIAKGNTSDVKELIPEFFYMPEFLENRFYLNLGEKQSGEKVGDVILPPWAKGSAREFIRRHREALECDYVSENLHHWIDLIFGYKQRGKAAEEAVNVFYHYTYEGSVDIDSISDPAIKASILAQINHFGQTPKQLFFKPHEKRRTDIRAPPHPLCHCTDLISHEVRKSSSLISQIVFFREKILTAGKNNMLKPDTYNEYIVWGFPDCSLRFVTYDQDKILSTHESLHGGNQIQSAGVTSDGQILVTGADDGMVAAWRINKDKARGQKHLHLLRNLCAHTAKVTCLYVCQPYMLIVTGSEDCSVILWDLNSLVFVKQLMEFPEPVTAIQVNDLTGEIITAAGTLLAVWSVNGDCLAFINTSQLPSDTILSVTSSTFSDWQDTNWYVTGHQSGSIKVWNMVHFTDDSSNSNELSTNETTRLSLPGTAPEYRLVLRRVLRYHKYPVTALLLTSDLRQLLGGDSSGNLLSWTLPDEGVRTSFRTRLSM